MSIGMGWASSTLQPLGTERSQWGVPEPRLSRYARKAKKSTRWPVNGGEIEVDGASSANCSSSSVRNSRGYLKSFS